MENKRHFLSINSKKNSCALPKLLKHRSQSTSAATEACHSPTQNHFAHFSDGYVYLGLYILLTSLREPG